MIKINWFARLFMSWKKIVEHIESSSQNDKNIALLEQELEITKKLLEEIKVEKEQINKFLMEEKNEKQSLTKKLESQIKDLELNKKKEIEQETSLAKAREQIEGLKETRLAYEKQIELIKNQINEKLTPLNKIERTFFGSTGNKGKGELGELQLKVLLEKSGLDKNIWTENLPVGKNSVDFAIKSGDQSDKWIPIDSKALETEIDEDTKKIIINDAYKQKVNAQVKKITKYLGKSNTESYGLLVLQNDEIYMELYKKYPTFFKEVIDEHKIYITSPSSFVQITWSIANIIEIYKKVHKEEKIYDQVISVLESVDKFSRKLSVTHKEFNTAMETHYPTIKNKQDKLYKELNKEGKRKELPNLNDKGQ
ncbi:MAG: DNA recombination protein RmuC [Mycoplasma sp.]|nr:DNA recombination protein RmuC [Mycoplasma sp.]